MPAPDLHRSLRSASSALSRWQAPLLPVRATQFCSALCLSPKTQACNHPQPSQRAQTAVQVRWSTARLPCVMYQYLPSSWHPDAVQLEMCCLRRYCRRQHSSCRRHPLTPIPTGQRKFCLLFCRSCCTNLHDERDNAILRNL